MKTPEKTPLKTALFEYNLPEELIAQSPLEERDQSRLLTIDPPSKKIADHTFSDLPNLLQKEDVLVINNTKVMPARLLGKRATGGKVEILLLEDKENTFWTALIQPSRRVSEDEEIEIAPNFKVRVHQKHINTSGHHLVQLLTEKNTIEEAIQTFGKTPLPPYVTPPATHKEKEIASAYQTVMAKKSGSVAAPTAGRHFTKNLLKQCQKKGIQVLEITLHVGYGTFKPISSDDIDDHIMHEEEYEIAPEVATQLNQAKKNNQNIIAVGTTVARTLESNIQNNTFQSGKFKTALFITPGYTLNAISGMITNFHLPKSTLFILISAILGINTTQRVYQHAIEQRYRFYSFGDAMLILPKRETTK